MWWSCNINVQWVDFVEKKLQISNSAPLFRIKQFFEKKKENDSTKKKMAKIIMKITIIFLCWVLQEKKKTMFFGPKTGFTYSSIGNADAADKTYRQLKFHWDDDRCRHRLHRRHQVLSQLVPACMCVYIYEIKM